MGKATIEDANLDNRYTIQRLSEFKLYMEKSIDNLDGMLESDDISNELRLSCKGQKEMAEQALQQFLAILGSPMQDPSACAVTEKLEYSDGKDYSHLKVNSEEHPEHSECIMCGSTEVTITDDSDICHECGYVYT